VQESIVWKHATPLCTEAVGHAGGSRQAWTPASSLAGFVDMKTRQT
jgi:hypothetical protein